MSIGVAKARFTMKHFTLVLLALTFTACGVSVQSDDAPAVDDTPTVQTDALPQPGDAQPDAAPDAVEPPDAPQVPVDVSAPQPDVFLPCGGYGQACCPNPTDAGAGDAEGTVASDPRCNVGALVCLGSTAPGTCTSCGGPGQPCCAARTCLDYATCGPAETCMACGGAGQRCCPGESCRDGRVCGGGLCRG